MCKHILLKTELLCHVFRLSVPYKTMHYEYKIWMTLPECTVTNSVIQEWAQGILKIKTEYFWMDSDEIHTFLHTHIPAIRQWRQPALKTKFGSTHLIWYWRNWLRAIEIWGCSSRCDFFLRFWRGCRLRMASTTVGGGWVRAEGGHSLISGRNWCWLGVRIWQWGWSSRGRGANWWNWHCISQTTPTMQIRQWIRSQGLAMGIWGGASWWSTWTSHQPAQRIHSELKYVQSLYVVVKLTLSIRLFEDRNFWTQTNLVLPINLISNYKLILIYQTLHKK